MGDDLVGLAGGSIYRKQERRSGILAVTRGSQRKKKSTGARESVASTVAVTPTSHGEAQGFTVMRWRGSSMWHMAGRRRFTGELICSSRKAGGKYGGESPELSLGHGFYLAALSGHRRRESQRRWRESRRRSVVGGERLKLIFFSTVP